jgi:RHS repeat-associated protein
MVKVMSGPTTVATYAYDGQNRRTTNTTGPTIRHHYYTQSWQIIEERVGSSTSADRQFVWGLRYMDDLVLRDQPGAGTPRLYAFHDYFNCTAVADVTGTVQERYGYDAFGQPRIMMPSFGNRTSSSYGWETLFADYRWDNESGFYQVRNRYLHSTLGRWLSRDPVEYGDGTNLYAYCKNRANNSVDPIGLSSTKSFKIVGKSYIALIGSSIGTAPPGGNQVALNDFAAATDLSYNETETNDAEDQGYRLYSERTFDITCDDNGKLKSVCHSLNTDSGLEPTKLGPIKAPALTIVSTRSGTSNNVFSFSWKVRGRPATIFEIPFTAVKTRTCKYIWHQVDGTIQCQNGQPIASATISGSSFPSGVLFINNTAVFGYPQGLFNGLWTCRPGSTTEIL